MAVRQARRALADDRAMEEEGERMNPVNPKRVLGSRKGRTSLVLEGDEYSGAGATPSMGLSQFRGGAHCSESDSGEEMVGRGTHKGQKRKTARRAYEGKSEAYEMGQHLSNHLHSLHGAGFWDDFKSGFMDVVRPIAQVAKTVAPIVAPGYGSLASAGLSALGLGKHKRRGGASTGAYEGKGKLTITHGGAMAENVSGPGYEALAGSGKSDGRRRRAEVVKQVMKEKGLSMIEASKYVKAHGLYK